MTGTVRCRTLEIKKKKSAALHRFYLDKGLWIIPIIASYAHAFRDHCLSNPDLEWGFFFSKTEI